MNRVVSDAALTVLYTTAETLHAKEGGGYTHHPSLDAEALDRATDWAQLEEMCEFFLHLVS